MKWFMQMVVALAVLFSGSSVYAADGNAALYDATAPADSAYVRVFNLTNAAIDVKVSSKSAAQPISAYQMGDYLFLAQGQHDIALGSLNVSLSFSKNEVKTLLFDGTQLKVVNDSLFESVKKARVGLYNFSSQAVALKTANGKHEVVKSVTPGDSGFREVNEIKMVFSAYQDGKSVATFDETFLKKGRSYSYVVYEENGGIVAQVVANKVASIE